MTAIKTAIYSALKASVALAAVVGTKIYSGWPPSTATGARVGFYRVSGQRGTASGLLSQRINELYSIDVFAPTMLETEKAEEAIDAAMNTLYYVVTAEHGPDLYEEDTQLYHKVLRYRVKS